MTWELALSQLFSLLLGQLFQAELLQMSACALLIFLAYLPFEFQNSVNTTCLELQIRLLEFSDNLLKIKKKKKSQSSSHWGIAHFACWSACWRAHKWESCEVRSVESKHLSLGIREGLFWNSHMKSGEYICNFPQ